MIKVHELLDWQLVEDAWEQGYISIQHHPTETLAVLNYSNKTQFEQAWTETTMTCRGLIYNTVTKEIVARPWKKFHNWGQSGAPVMDLGASVDVYDKLDGSMGALYRRPSDGRYAVATRGSFTSDQAKHATQVWEKQYADRFNGPPGMTFLMEIVYPENRIVLDYHGIDDLILLDVIDTQSGRRMLGSLAPLWPGPVVEKFSYRTLEEALNASPRPNCEGYVVTFTETGEMVKLKQADYVALHRIMTNTTPRVIWQYLAVNACAHLIPENKPKMWASRLGIFEDKALQILAVGPNWLEQMAERVPDEFHDWLKTMVIDINLKVEDLAEDIMVQYAGIRHIKDQREFVMAADPESRHFHHVLALRNGHDITTELWRKSEPAATKPWMTVDESVA
jgi:putative RNA ligase